MSAGGQPAGGSGIGVDPGSVRIFDTTLRDGEQAPGAGLTAAEKLEVARQLVRLKVDVIEAGFPAASPGDFEAVHRIAEETRGVAVAALARCRDGDPQRAVEAIRIAERPHLHVFIATTDIHLKHKLRIDRDEALRRGRPVGRLRPAASSAPTPRSSSRAEDASRTDPDYLLDGLRGRRRRRGDHGQHPGHRRLRHPGRVRRARRAGRRAGRPRAPPSRSTATTTSAWPRPTRWPPCRPARARSRSRSTGSASGPATPRSRRS